MSDMTCHNVTKTNFFRVNDEDLFRDFMSRVKTLGEKIQLHEHSDSKGTWFAFSVKGSLLGYVLPSKDHNYLELCDTGNLGRIASDVVENVDALCDELMTHVHKHDAIIIFEFGHDVNGSVAGCAKILTNTGNSFLDLRGMAIEKAAEMLELPDWTTEILD